MGLLKKQIKTFGFPLREEFFTPKDLASIKQDFQITTDKPIIMILMGAAGSNKIVTYVEKIIEAGISFHIIACIGKNEEARKKLQGVILPKNITLSIIGQTKRIADLMAISDVLITKSGPTSLCEAIQMELPIIIDGTSVALDWEQLHRDFVEEHKLGHVITDYDELPQALKKSTHNKNYINEIRQKMRTLKNPNFKKNIIKLIDRLTNREILCHADGTCDE